MPLGLNKIIITCQYMVNKPMYNEYDNKSNKTHTIVKCLNIGSFDCQHGNQLIW